MGGWWGLGAGVSWVRWWRLGGGWGLRPNVALGACDAPKVALGGWDAPNTALGALRWARARWVVRGPLRESDSNARDLSRAA